MFKLFCPHNESVDSKKQKTKTFFKICVPQKESHTALEWHEGEIKCSFFWMNCQIDIVFI